MYPAISPPIARISFVLLLFFLSWIYESTKFSNALRVNIALVIFKFNLTLRLKITGTGMKFEVLLPRPSLPRNRERRVARIIPKRETGSNDVAFYISHPPRITVKITGREHAFRGGYVDRYDPPRYLPFSLGQT